MTKRRGIVIGLLAGASMISWARAFAQSPVSDTSADDEIKLFRKDVIAQETAYCRELGYDRRRSPTVLEFLFRPTSR
jgi:hypothetical protein